MMIQRIQTLYLLIVTALMAVTLFVPLAWFAGDAGEFGLYAFALKTAEGEAVQPAVYMGVVLALACALPLVTIFLFRRPRETSAFRDCRRNTSANVRNAT